MSKVLEWLHSPGVMAKFHGVVTMGWLVMLPICILTPLKDSVPFLVAISVWALVGSHWAGYQGARAEMSNGDDEPKEAKVSVQALSIYYGTYSE